jgi:pimeloyl-ACP methyl ester carboxylesterase
MTRYITVAANGLEFEVLQAGDGDKLALCLHGFPEHAEMWRHHIDTLVGLGYRVWAPNQRGYGHSSKPDDVMAYHVDHLVADIAALIDASGAREVTLVAHDWGAVVAWFFAMRNVRPIEKLVIINVPHPAVYARVVTTSWRQPLRSWYILAFQIPLLPEWLLSRRAGKRLTQILRETSLRPEGFTEQELSAYALQVADRKTARAMIAWYRAAVRSGLFLGLRNEAIPIIETPTLMIWGEDDHALGKETTYGTDVYVRDLKIAYLSGCSHWVSQDAPERANALLTSFLT